MSITPYTSQPPGSKPELERAGAPRRWVELMVPAAELAKQIAGTEFVPESIRDSPAKIAAAILYGDELGLGPMQALRWIAVIKGRTAMMAEGHRAMILADGHELWVEEATTTRVTIAGRRRGSDTTTRVTWTMDDAKRAGLAGNPAYRAYPRQMLIARASAELARTIFADVIGGLPAVEEIESLDGAAPPAEPPPPPDAVSPSAPAGRTRRRRPAPTDAAPTPPVATVSAPPPPQPEPEPVDPAGEPLATDAYKRRIFATMRDLDLAAGLDEAAARKFRLAYVSRAAGRTVTSSNELTIGEAGRVIEQLDADKQARDAGEQGVLDAIRREFDAVEVSPGGDAEESDEPKTEPIPYNEFPPGF